MGNKVTPKPSVPIVIPPVRRPVTGTNVNAEGYPNAVTKTLGDKPVGAQK